MNTSITDFQTAISSEVLATEINRDDLAKRAAEIDGVESLTLMT